jgi:hypothetical protein
MTVSGSPLLNAKLAQGAVHVLGDMDQHRLFAGMAAAPPCIFAGAVRALPARLGAFAGLGAGCATASGVIGLGAGGTASSSKMPARADGFFAITQSRLLA